MDEMHHFWCEREEAKAATPGSPLDVLCENYELHKAAQKVEL